MFKKLTVSVLPVLASAGNLDSVDLSAADKLDAGVEL